MIDPVQKAVESFGAHLFKIDFLRFSFCESWSVECRAKVFGVFAQVTFVYKDGFAFFISVMYIDCYNGTTRQGQLLL